MNMQYNEGRYEDELLKKLDEIGFTEISPDAFIKKFPEFQDKIRRPIQNVWGLKMRADAWADTWVMKVDDKYNPYITHIDGKQRMWSGALFVLGFLKKISESLKEQLVEKLSKNQPAGEWIHDFVYSKNPKFAGKTKKERIKMALGAYYAAQKNEDVDASTLFKANDDSIDYDPDQLAAGIKIEMEHTDDKEIATIIAKHHLAEDPEYYIKLASCVEKGVEEEYGAGFEGTDELRKKYIKDTPGQKIQHFKTNMKEKSLDEAVSTKFIDDLLDAANQVQKKNKQLRQGQSIMIALKDMNSTLYSDITGTEIDPFYNDKKIPAMLKHLNPNWKFSQMDEAYGESWVVYNKDTKAKISKSFKTRKAAYDYASKNGGVVYSAEYYFDHQDEIHSGKLVKEESLDEAINIRDYMATSEKSQFGGYRPKVVHKDGRLMYLSQAAYNTADEAKDHAEDYLKQYARGISEPRVPIKGTYVKEALQGNQEVFDAGDTAGLDTSEISSLLSQAFKKYNNPNKAKAELISIFKMIKDSKKDLSKFYGDLSSLSSAVYESTKKDLNENEDKYPTWIIKPRDGGEPVKIKAQDETSAIEIALGRKPSQHEIDFFNFHYICICEQIELPTLRNMKIVELATNCNDESLVKEFVEQQYKPNSSVLEIKESFKSFISNK